MRKEKIQVLRSLSGGQRSSCYCCAAGSDQLAEVEALFLFTQELKGFLQSTFFYSLMFKVCSLAYQR
jgi:hypothetical protein